MKIELSERMQAVSALVPKGHVAADIGCDHGFVSIDLVQRSICPHVYAADVRKGPLDRAKEHIAACGLKDKITAVLSDGLKDVPDRKYRKTTLKTSVLFQIFLHYRSR